MSARCRSASVDQCSSRPTLVLCDRLLRRGPPPFLPAAARPTAGCAPNRPDRRDRQSNCSNRPGRRPRIHELRAQQPKRAGRMTPEADARDPAQRLHRHRIHPDPPPGTGRRNMPRHRPSRHSPQAAAAPSPPRRRFRLQHRRGRGPRGSFCDAFSRARDGSRPPVTGVPATTARNKVRNIALSQLSLSPTNVRKTPATSAKTIPKPASAPGASCRT